MDEELLQQVFDELFQSLEAAETQSAAILQFLKAKGIANADELAPHLAQASKSSSVRGVATRARINRLLSAANKSPETAEDHKAVAPTENETENESDKPAEEKSDKPGATGSDSAEKSPSPGRVAKEGKQTKPQNAEPETKQEHDGDSRDTTNPENDAVKSTGQTSRAG